MTPQDEPGRLAQHKKQILLALARWVKRGRAIPPLERLQERWPDVPPADLAHLRRQAELIEGGSPPPDNGPPPRPHLRDYQILDQDPVTGGMGVIYRGREEALGRDVAIKAFWPREPGLRTSERLRDCFRREGEVTAALESPFIVPVYRVGTLRDGRPFYVMRWVNGMTLEEALRAPGLPLPPGYFLKAFEQLTQAVHDAHAAGFVHRDLTPRNVMLDVRFGVQVIDWGFAKRAGVAECTTSETEHADITRYELHSASLLGGARLFGTPGYLSPEQASRETIGLTDERSDVYSLGAILYRILTGTAPTGFFALPNQPADPAAVWDRLDGALTEERTFWVGLTKKCLRIERAERLRDAGEVHALILEHQQQQAERVRRDREEAVAAAAREREALKTVEVERREQQALNSALKAEQKARRRTKLLAGGVVLFVVTFACAAGWFVHDRGERRREEEARRAAQDQRRAVCSAEVAPLLDRAEDFLRDGQLALAHPLIERAEGRLGEEALPELRTRLDRAKRDLKTAGELERLRLEFLMAKPTRAVPAKGAAFAVLQLDASVLAGPLRAALLGYGLGLDGEDVSPVVKTVRGSTIRHQLIQGIDSLAFCSTEPGERAHLLGLSLAADDDPFRTEFREAWKGQDWPRVVAMARRLDPTPQPGSTITLVTAALWGAGEYPLLVQLLRRAQGRHPGDFYFNNDLAVLLVRTSQTPEARAEGVRFAQAAVALKPSSAYAHNTLGYVLTAVGRTQEAEESYRKALDIDPTLAVIRLNLGMLYYQLRDWDHAVAEWEQLTNRGPVSALALANIAAAMLARNQYEQAMSYCRQALDIDPRCAMAYVNLASAEVEKRLIRRARQSCTRALAIDPGIAEAYHVLGSCAFFEKKYEDAISNFKRAIELNPALAKSHVNLGLALEYVGKTEEAVEACRSAIRLNPPPEELSAAYVNLANALRSKLAYDEAVTASRKALEIRPGDLDASANLALALHGQGHFNEALTRLRDVYTRLAWTDPRWLQLRPALTQLEKDVALEKRVADYLARGGRPKTAAEAAECGWLCYRKKSYGAAVTFYEMALGGGPLPDKGEEKHRYDAACSAALAAAGEGTDAPPGAPAELRRKALVWLRANLQELKQRWEKEPAGSQSLVVRKLSHWRKDADLAGLREPAKRVRYPASEQKEWEGFWKEVDALLGSADSAKQPATEKKAIKK